MTTATQGYLSIVNPCLYSLDLGPDIPETQDSACPSSLTSLLLSQKRLTKTSFPTP